MSSGSQESYSDKHPSGAGPGHISLIQRLHRWSRWFWEHGHFLLLCVVLLIVGGIWTFAQIADEVVEGETQHFDDWAIQSLRGADGLPRGPAWAREAGRDLTALGGMAVLTMVVGAVLGYLLMDRKRQAAILVAVATSGAFIASTILKWSFDRPRPNVTHYSYVYTSSFPSGHAMLSASVYLTLGSLLTRLVPSRRLKLYFLLIALALTFLIGISRVYMGVHYPTDVLAGWTAGLVWALICWLAARQLQKRGTIERDTQPAIALEPPRDA